MLDVISCLSCGGRSLINFINFGDKHPLANSYPSKPKYDLPTYPLRVEFCVDCSHCQLDTQVEPELLFKDYLYVSGTTETLKRHFVDLANESLLKVKGGSVLDIGCNDGSLMLAFQEAGAEDVQGVDPAENLAQEREDKIGYKSHVAYWSMETAKTVGKFNLITGLNVFAHNLNPLGFLLACKEALASEGLILIEFPYAKNTFLGAQDGQIYHEHLSYFNVKSFSTLAQRADLGIVDLKEVEVHGGSIRFYLQKGAEHCQKVQVYIEEEKRLGLDKLETYEAFAEQVKKNYQDLLVACATQQSLGYKVVGFGAAAKTSTVLNALEGHLKLPYIIDNNPLKVERYIPGVNINIEPIEVLRKEIQPLCIVIFAFNFLQEIKNRIKAVVKDPNKVVILTYVPSVRIEDL